MKTLLGLLTNRCGLSQRETSEFLNARIDTIKSWQSGRRQPPDGVIAELRSLSARIEKTADETIKIIAAQKPDVIEFGLASDDEEARSLGWPCVGAHVAVLGIVAARINCAVKIVPCGSTKSSNIAMLTRVGKIQR